MYPKNNIARVVVWLAVQRWRSPAVGMSTHPGGVLASSALTRQQQEARLNHETRGRGSREGGEIAVPTQAPRP
uniref:Uncharacterized protein n=1 Tax=Arundo donax TaxID=35708 RepID=A0A0A9G9R9_ARUDO